MKNYLAFLIVIVCQLSKVSAQHDLIWQQQQAHSIGQLIMHNSESNIIVCGTYGNDYPSDWGDIITTMYDTNGNQLWTNIYNDTINGGIDEPFDLSIDRYNNIYIVGRTHTSYDGLPITPNALLLKYDKFGNLIWKKEYGDSAGLEGGARRMKLVNDRDIYIAGYMDSIGVGNHRSFLAKLDTSGQFHWVFVDGNTFETIGRDVEVDANNNVYLLGTSACCIPGYKMFVSKFDSSGNPFWQTVLYDSAHIYAYTWEGAIDDSANIFLTAETQDTLFSTGYDCAIAKVDSSGNQKWFSDYTSSTNPNDWDESKDILADKQGNVYVCGTVGTAIAGFGFVIKVNRDGAVIWDNLYNGNGDANGLVSLAISSPDTIAAIGGGTFDGGNTFGLGIVQFDSSGTEYFKIIESGPYTGYSLAYLNGSIYATGDNTNIDSHAYDDSLFVFKYSDSLFDLTTDFLSNNDGCFFPNPFEQSLQVLFRMNDNIGVLEIFNATGEKIIQKRIGASDIINTVELPSGLYVAQIRFDKIIIRSKILKQ